MKTTNKDNIGFLFDLDGVIIDSESRYTEIWGEINGCFPTGVAQFEHKIKGTTLDNILSTYFDEADRDSVVAMLNEKEQAMVYDYLPGAKELLETIKESSLAAALVTSSNDKKMEHLLSQHPELKGLFRQIIDATMVIRSKPDPEGYLKGAEAIGANPRQCVVFEDSVQGVKAGKASGAYVVGVAGTVPEEALRPYADAIVGNQKEIDFSQLCGILKLR